MSVQRKKHIRQINFVTFPCFDGRSSPEQAAGRIVLITALCCTTVVSPVALLIIPYIRKNFRSKSFPTVQQKYFRGIFNRKSFCEFLLLCNFLLNTIFAQRLRRRQM